jgi:hypothetical protein
MKLFLLVLFLVGVLALGISIRQSAISSCRDRDGQPVTDPWYSETWHVVRCLEGDPR